MEWERPSQMARMGADKIEGREAHGAMNFEPRDGQDLHGLKIQGCAWASQDGAALSNPFASEPATGL